MLFYQLEFICMAVLFTSDQILENAFEAFPPPLAPQGNIRPK